MSPSVQIYGKTRITGKTLILRGTATPTPSPTPSPPANCQWFLTDAAMVFDYSGSGFNLGFGSYFDENYPYLTGANSVTLNSVASNSPFAYVKVIRVSPSTDPRSGVRNFSVTASIAASPPGYIASVRVWYNKNDYDLANPPDLSHTLTDTNPMSETCLESSQYSSIVEFSFQPSVAPPGTFYGYGFMQGSVTAYPFLLEGSSRAVVVSDGSASALTSDGYMANGCAALGTCSWSMYVESCLTDIATWKVAYSIKDDYFIAFEYGGTKVRIGNGANSYFTRGVWTAGGALPASVNWTAGVSDGSSYFLLVPNNSTTYAYTANGGTSWSSGTLPSTGNTIAYALSYYVVPTNGTTLCYSSDGTSWSTTTLPTSANWVSAFEYSTYIYLFSSTGHVLRASNITGPWTTIATSGKTFSKVVSGPTNTFVGIISSTSISYSTDSGANWTDVDLTGINSGLGAHDICYAPYNCAPAFLVINKHATLSYLSYSSDGSTWSYTSMPEEYTNSIAAMY